MIRKSKCKHVGFESGFENCKGVNVTEVRGQGGESSRIGEQLKARLPMVTKRARGREEEDHGEQEGVFIGAD